MNAEAAYLFRHAVLRDAAYALHLPSERSELHLLAIECLDGTGDADAVAAELARHAMQAQDGADRTGVEQLAQLELAFRQRAAAYAMTREATAEVVEHMLRLAELPQPNLKARIDCLARAGSMSMGMGQLARAEGIAQRMHDLASAAGDAVQRARSLRALMAVEATIGKPDLADAHLQESLEILERHGDRGELASTLRAFALHSLSRGRYDDAQRWIDRARPLAVQDEWEYALLHDTQAELRRQQGRVAEALEGYRESIRLSLKLGNVAKARDTRAGLAGCLVELGRLDEAEAEAKALTEEFAKAGRAGDVSSVSMLLATAQARRGNHAEAVRMYRAIVNAQTDQGRIWYQIDANGKMAESLCEAGRFDEALQAADECLRLSLEQDSRSGIAKARWLRGLVFSERGRLREAEHELILAAEMQETLREGNRLALIQAKLAEVRQALNFNR